MPEPRFHKGDVVRFRFGLRLVQGVVKEDRGPIGKGGRRLYSVEFLPTAESNPPALIELPAVALEAVNGAVSTK